MGLTAQKGCGECALLVWPANHCICTRILLNNADIFCAVKQARMCIPVLRPHSTRSDGWMSAGAPPPAAPQPASAPHAAPAHQSFGQEEAHGNQALLPALQPVSAPHAAPAHQSFDQERAHSNQALLPFFQHQLASSFTLFAFAHMQHLHISRVPAKRRMAIR